MPVSTQRTSRSWCSRLVSTARSPRLPANLQATAGTGQVALSWQASTDNVGVTGYRVFRGTDPDREPRRIGDLLHGHRPRSGPVQLHGARDRRRAEPVGPEQHGERDRAGHHEADGPRQLSPPPPAPARSRCSWQASTDNVGVTGYRVFRGTDPDREPRARPRRPTRTPASPRARTATRCARSTPRRTCPTRATRQAPPCRTPRSRRRPATSHATAGTGQVALTWQASTRQRRRDRLPGLPRHRPDREPRARPRRPTPTRGLAPGPYSYTVRAIDAAQNLSDPSNTASATVPDTTKPTAPGNLQRDRRAPARSRSPGRPRRDNVGVTGYRVFRGDHADREPGRVRDLLHGHRPRPGPVQLHRARDRRRAEPVRPEQHGERHGGGHHRTDRPPEPHGDAQRLEEGRPDLGGLDRQRRRHRLPGLPRSRGDREHRRHGDFLHGHTNVAPRSTQLHGARPGRRRQPIRLQRPGERRRCPDTSKPTAPDQPRRDRRTAPTQVGPHLGRVDRRRRRGRLLGLPRRQPRGHRRLGHVLLRRGPARHLRPTTVRAVDAAGNLSDPSNTDTRDRDAA